MNTDPLTQYQKDFLAEKNTRAMLVWSTGTFKSRTSIEWAKIWGGTTLVVCPKGLKTNWERELKKWGYWTAYVSICSKEEFKNESQPKYDNLIIDEADHFFGMKSMLSKSLLAYIKAYNPRVLMLTATPLRGTPWNIYRAAQFLGHNWNYRTFQDKFFFGVYMGPRLVFVPKKDDKTKELMRNTIASIANVVRMEDHFDVPEQTYETVYLDEDATQKRMKKESQAIVAIAKFTDDHRAESMNQNKFEYIDRLIEEVEGPVAVVCRYHEQIDEFIDRLDKAGITFGEISGRLPTDRRQVNIDEANAGRVKVLLIQSSTVEGYGLPNVSAMVFASLDFSYRNYTQALGRLQRGDNIKKNVYVTLLSGEADEAVWAAVQNKTDFDPIRYKRV